MMDEAYHDARALAALFLLRFPRWASCVPDPGSADARDPADPEWSLVFRLPPDHPNVKEPMDVRVRQGEVLIRWIHGWHWHVFRCTDSELADVKHLHEALDRIEEVVTEKLSIITLFRGDHVVSGGGIRPGTDPPLDSLQREGPGSGDRWVIVSWRGADDREFHRMNA